MMKYTSNGKEYEVKLWHIVLCVFILLYSMGRCSMKQNANETQTIEQRDRTEIYYNDENGNPIKRETIYKDGRPTEYKYY